MNQEQNNHPGPLSSEMLVQITPEMITGHPEEVPVELWEIAKNYKYARFAETYVELTTFPKNFRSIYSGDKFVFDDLWKTWCQSVKEKVGVQSPDGPCFFYTIDELRNHLAPMPSLPVEQIPDYQFITISPIEGGFKLIYSNHQLTKHYTMDYQRKVSILVQMVARLRTKVLEEFDAGIGKAVMEETIQEDPQKDVTINIPVKNLPASVMHGHSKKVCEQYKYLTIYRNNDCVTAELSNQAQQGENTSYYGGIYRSYTNCWEHLMYKVTKEYQNECKEMSIVSSVTPDTPTYTLDVILQMAKVLRPDVSEEMVIKLLK